MKFIYWDEFPSLIAGTSTRLGGVSKNNYRSLNLSYEVGDDPLLVKKNRELFFSALDIEVDQIIFTKQHHSTIIAKVDLRDGGRGASEFADGINGDALYTYEKNLYLAIYHADCVPILFYAPKYGLIGIIHAGDEGTLNGVSEKVIREVIEKEKIEPSELHFYFGPSVSFGHNEISKEKAEAIASLDKVYARGVKRSLGTYFLDTPFINFLQLRKLGVPTQNITFSHLCTHENDHIFYAAGKEHPSGRLVSFIARV